MEMIAFKKIKTALLLLLVLTLITGIIYPAIVTLIAQICFPWRANGSLIEHNNQAIGSVLIGQSFTEAKYFWSRPSATIPFPYNAEYSSGSNLGPTNPVLLTAVKARVDALKKLDPTNKRLIPVDLVTASASGLDPDISILAAYYQVPRIAKIRKMNENAIYQLIQNLTTQCSMRILGEARVNVLQLNLALDNING